MKKGWLIKQSFDNEFVNKLDELYQKYGEEIFSIQGIANKHMDIVAFSEEFFGKSSNVAEVSVDGNANVREKNIIQYNFENNKALMKLNSLYLLWKWVYKIYTKEDADIALEKVLNGELFVNDLTNYQMSYCFAFDLRNLLNYGMNFFKGNMKIHPPKRSDSFIALLIQCTAYISNQIMGAASYPDFFPVLDWFYRKEMGENYIGNMKRIEIIVGDKKYSVPCNVKVNVMYENSDRIEKIGINKFKENYNDYLIDIDELEIYEQV